MKKKRHAIIKKIIGLEIIETQEELTAALKRQHIEVTQATVSRDIKELMLIKIPTKDGRYRYASPGREGRVFSKERMARLFSDNVLDVDFSENIIVLKTLPGSAGTVAAMLDQAGWEEVIGTVAGDDNILAVVKPKEAVPEVIERLKALESL